MALANYTDLQAQVSSWVKRTGDTDFAAVLPDLIALAEVRIARDLKSLSLERSSPVSVTAGVQSYAIPGDAISLIRVDRPDGLSLESYDPSIQYPEAVGRPEYYYFERNQLQVYPKPDANTTLTLVYRGKLVPLATTPTNQVLTDYPNVYLWASVTEAYLWLLDEQRAIQYEGRYQKAVKDANRANNWKRMTLLATDLPRNYRYDIRSM